MKKTKAQKKRPTKFDDHIFVLFRKPLEMVRNEIEDREELISRNSSHGDCTTLDMAATILKGNLMLH